MPKSTIPRNKTKHLVGEKSAFNKRTAPKLKGSVGSQSNKRAASPRASVVVDNAIKRLSSLPVTQESKFPCFDVTRIQLSLILDSVFYVFTTDLYQATFLDRLIADPLLCRRYLNSLEDNKFKHLAVELILKMGEDIKWFAGKNHRTGKEIKLHPAFLIVLDCATNRSHDCVRILLSNFDIVSIIMLSLGAVEKEFIRREFSSEFKADYIVFFLQHYLQEGQVAIQFIFLDLDWMCELIFSRGLTLKCRKILLSDELFLRRLLSPYLDEFFDTITTVMKDKTELRSLLLFNLCVLLGVRARKDDAKVTQSFRDDWFRRIKMCLKIFSMKEWLICFKTKHGDACPLDVLIQYQDADLTKLVTGIVKKSILMVNRKQILYVSEYVRIFRRLLALPETREQALVWLSTSKVPSREGRSKDGKSLLLALTGSLPGLEMLSDYKEDLHKIPLTCWLAIDKKTGTSALWRLCCSNYYRSPDERCYTPLNKPLGEETLSDSGNSKGRRMHIGLAILHYWLDREEAVRKVPDDLISSESESSQESFNFFVKGLFTTLGCWGHKCCHFDSSVFFRATTPYENLDSTAFGEELIKRMKKLFPDVWKNSTTAHSPGASRSLTH